MIDVMPPWGRFRAGLVHRPRRVLAVASGSSITPLLSIVHVAHFVHVVLDRDAQANCTPFYGNRSTTSVMFKVELEDLKNRDLARLALRTVFSREEVDSPLHSDRLDASKIATLLRMCGPVDRAYVCGPHATNDKVEAALIAAGLPAEDIHVERFGVPPALAAAPPPASRASNAATASVRIVPDGMAREVAFGAADANILAAATRAGMDLPFSCASGVSATCRARCWKARCPWTATLHSNAPRSRLASC